MELEEYIQYHETKLHEQPGFRYDTYLCTIPDDFSRVSLHWHEQMEIVYIKKGEGIMTIGTQTFRVGAGMIVPIMPGELHSIEGADDARMEYENIIFSLSILDSTEENDWVRAAVIEPLQSAQLRFARPIVPGTELHRAASAALDSADRACAERKPGYSLLVKSYLFLFLHALFAYKETDGDSETFRHELALKKVLGYVKEHFSEEISVEQAANLAGYSASHFMRMFREETGRTFSRYVLDYRISYASYLLKESSGAVGDIAMACGFNNFSYFIRTFKKHYGVSPRQYRQTV
jgi:AraC-like DNA-binding protein/mannose-6-phosphate isomerase-like protein (cupin superfamily)